MPSAKRMGRRRAANTSRLRLRHGTPGNPREADRNDPARTGLPTQRFSLHTVTTELHRLGGLAAFAVRFFILRSEGPLFVALVTNDTCNLDCIDCRVANTKKSCMPFEDIRRILQDYYRRGARFLTVSGGEPYLWHDGALRLREVVALAREIGFLHVSIFTNGTVPMNAGPDFTWISIDGVAETFRKVRGIPLERVLRNVRGFRGRFGIVHTVNTVNYREIPTFLRFIQREVPKAPVFFFFHTPYYGVDDLLLSPAQRREVVETLLACKRQGLPVFNSKAGLKAYLKGFPGLPARYCKIVDETGEFDCCRAIVTPEVCADCGYSVSGELAQARKLNPGAIWALMTAT